MVKELRERNLRWYSHWQGTIDEHNEMVRRRREFNLEDYFRKNHTGLNKGWPKEEPEEDDEG
jgi:hypothetical protein